MFLEAILSPEASRSIIWYVHALLTDFNVTISCFMILVFASYIVIIIDINNNINVIINSSNMTCITVVPRNPICEVFS